MQTTPPSIDYDGVRAGTPPVSQEKNVLNHPGSNRVIFRGEHPFDRYSQPGTPELDTNTSSSSSTGSVPAEISGKGDERSVQGEKKKKGLTGWLKSKTKRS